MKTCLPNIDKLEVPQNLQNTYAGHDIKQISEFQINSKQVLKKDTFVLVCYLNFLFCSVQLNSIHMYVTIQILTPFVKKFEVNLQQVSQHFARIKSIWMVQRPGQQMIFLSRLRFFNG
jgi:hypothetical protein